MDSSCIVANVMNSLVHTGVKSAGCPPQRPTLPLPTAIRAVFELVHPERLRRQIFSLCREDVIVLGHGASVGPSTGTSPGTPHQSVSRGRSRDTARIPSSGPAISSATSAKATSTEDSRTSTGPAA